MRAFAKSWRDKSYHATKLKPYVTKKVANNGVLKCKQSWIDGKTTSCCSASRENAIGVIDIGYHACEDYLDNTYYAVFLNYHAAPYQLSYCSKALNKLKVLCRRPWMSIYKFKNKRTGMRSVDGFGKSKNRTRASWFWIKKSHVKDFEILRELQDEGIITYAQVYFLVKRILYESHAEYMYNEDEFKKLEIAYGTEAYHTAIEFMFPEGHTTADKIHLDYWRRKMLYEIAIEHISEDKQNFIRSQLINNTVMWTEIRMHEYLPAAHAKNRKKNHAAGNIT